MATRAKSGTEFMKSSPISNIVHCLDAFFKVSERKSTISREILAGVAGFMCNSHLLVVVPRLMDDVGHEGTFFGFVISTVFATLSCSLLTGLPLLLGPGVGGAAYLSANMKEAPELGTNVVYTVGLVLLLMAVLQLPERLYMCLPSCVKASVPTGIGLYLSLIGFMLAHIIVSDDHAGIQLGSCTDPVFILGVAGVGSMLALEVIDERYTSGRLGFFTLVLPILGVSTLGWAMGTSPLPSNFFSQELVVSPSFVNFEGLNSWTWIANTVQLLLVAFFDIGGLMCACLGIAGLTDKLGRFGFNSVFAICGLSTLLAGYLNSGPVIIFGESIAAVLAGGRTGLTGIVCAACFLAAIFFAPLLMAVPSYATAPPLISVGWNLLPVLLINVANGGIDSQCRIEVVCMFFTCIGMAFFHGIDKGILAGLGLYCFLKLVDLICSIIAGLCRCSNAANSDQSPCSNPEEGDWSNSSKRSARNVSSKSASSTLTVEVSLGGVSVSSNLMSRTVSELGSAAQAKHAARDRPSAVPELLESDTADNASLPATSDAKRLYPSLLTSTMPKSVPPPAKSTLDPMEESIQSGKI